MTEERIARLNELARKSKTFRLNFNLSFIIVLFVKNNKYDFVMPECSGNKIFL